jgi:AcrR family transcriptional regulator
MIRSIASMESMEERTPAPLSGRRAQAAVNDVRILDAARAVFVANPGAAISAVAKHAGVGISALYRRYDSKEALLRHLCADGLARYIAAVEEALAGGRDPQTAFADFMRRVVEADSHSLTLRLAGTFTPTEELRLESDKAQELDKRLVDRMKVARVIRPDLTADDLSFVFEQLAAVRVGDSQRTRALRLRYLALQLDAICNPSAMSLPGPPPTWEEVSRRWES